MKLETGKMYFKKEIKRTVGVNDSVKCVSKYGSTLSRFWWKLNDDDEVLLKEIQDTVGIDMYPGAQEYKCKIYIVEIPEETVKRIRQKIRGEIK